MLGILTDFFFGLLNSFSTISYSFSDIVSDESCDFEVRSFMHHFLILLSLWKIRKEDSLM